jgi:para-aminobenzoate synthetase component 1
MNYPLIEEIHLETDATKCFEVLAPRSYSFWLDSGMDPQKLGRWSFMGSDPFLVMRSRGEEITLIKAGAEEKRRGNPFDILGELLEEYKMESGESKVPFTGGAVGYFSYDLCHFIERLPKKALDDLELPECYFAFYDNIVAFDHKDNKGYIISTGFPEREEGKRRGRAEARLNELRSLIQNSPPPSPMKEIKGGGAKLKANFSHRGYLEAVAKAREYIGAGDIFQVNLSQRFEVELKTKPYELYQRLRQINPAPFASYLNFEGVCIAGASPERFLKLQGDMVETRPIKGTKPRGRTPEEDRKMAADLMASKKDRAENIMIVDLERNDLGRVCRYGTVKVSELAILETYPTVYHLTSTVTGRLREGISRIDLLKASFPGGSITGAPKVRAMEIIDELEPTRRSVYTGSIGYLGFNGGMDLNIVIRTFIIKDGRAYFQVGGAIVYDSVPEAEYIETLDKGKALMQTLGLSMGEIT